MSIQMIKKRHNGYGASHPLEANARTDGFPITRERQTLYNVGRSRRHLAKEIIYRESDQVDRLYLIRSGLVKLLSYLPNGRARIVRLHASGHWIGLETSFNGTPHTQVTRTHRLMAHRTHRSLEHIV